MPSNESQVNPQLFSQVSKAYDQLTIRAAQLKGLTCLLDGEDNDNFDTMNDTLKHGVWSLLSSLAIEIDELLPILSNGLFK